MELEMIAQILDNKIKMNSDEIVMERKTVNLFRKKVSSSQLLLCILHQAAFSECLKLTACKFSEVTILK
jgi:ribonuclease HIII